MIKMKEKAEIVLRALLKGHGVKLVNNLNELHLGEDYSIGPINLDGNTIIPLDMTLKDFIVNCNKLSEAEIMDIVSSMVLTEINNKKT